MRTTRPDDYEQIRETTDRIMETMHGKKDVVKYEIVFTKHCFDIGLCLERSSEGTPLKVMGRPHYYNACPLYGGVSYTTWYSTGIFITKEEWSNACWPNKPVEELVIRFGLQEHYRRGEAVRIYEEAEKRPASNYQMALTILKKKLPPEIISSIDVREALIYAEKALKMAVNLEDSAKQMAKALEQIEEMNHFLTKIQKEMIKSVPVKKWRSVFKKQDGSFLKKEKEKEKVLEELADELLAVFGTLYAYDLSEKELKEIFDAKLEKFLEAEKEDFDDYE